jgi:hypothetical protein
MKKPILSTCLALAFLAISSISNAQTAKPDTVRVGIYITSIHNIDFKQKEFAATFWLWLKYKNKAFDFYNNLEVPMAKSVNKSFVTVDSSNGRIYMQMKLECIIKDSWKINNFPFDTEKLRLSIENSQYDSRSLVFVADTLGDHYDKRYALNGWNVDSCIIATGTKAYETGFGDETLKRPHTEYSTFRVRLSIRRDAMELFWKVFLGMYIAFLIAYVCFYIHSDGMDSRFGLSVGSLFAVIGNKYIIDSSLPESTSFTLVDTLHGLTLFSIFAIITATAYSLKLVKSNKLKQADRFDFVFAQILLVVYVAFNVYFIFQAKNS